MARRRSSKRKTHHTRRVGRVKVPAVGKKALGTVIGVVGSRLLTKVAGAKLDPKILAAGKVVGGFLLTRSRSDLMEGMGYGVMAGGVLDAGTAFNLPLLNGIGAANTFTITDNGRRALSAARDIPKVSGSNTMNYPKPNVIGKRSMGKVYGSMYG